MAILLDAKKVYFSNSSEVTINASEGRDLITQLLGTFMVNLENLGYSLSLDFMENFRKLNYHSALDVAVDVIDSVRKIVGLRSYQPMYPGFPKQVMDMSEAELFINAVTHYLSLGSIYPDMDDRYLGPRPMLDEYPKYEILEYSDSSDTIKYLKVLLMSNREFSPYEKKLITMFWGNADFSEVFEQLDIKNKENLAWLVELLGFEKMLRMTKTATDVLRTLIAREGGDVSLSKNQVKWVNDFSRKVRREVLGTLNKMPLGLLKEDLLRYKKMWLRLGELIHPGDYKNKFAISFAAFDALRNHKIQSFMGKINTMPIFKNRLEMLSKRPGVFLRMLDSLLRNRTNVMTDQVLYYLPKVAAKASPRVIYQLISHFKNRDLNRFYFKKTGSQPFLLEPSPGIILDNVITSVIDILNNAIIKQYSVYIDVNAEINSVFIDENFRGCSIPGNSRNSSSGSSLNRLSKKVFPVHGFLRFFIYWKNIENRPVDVDLSIGFLNSITSEIKTLSYNNLIIEELGAYHSGDIIDAPQGAAEFVDVNLQKTLNQGFDMILPQVINFSQIEFSKMSDALFGWMERKDIVSGEVFEPRTVKGAVDLRMNSINTIPCMFNINTGQMTWLDINFDGHFVNIKNYLTPDNIAMLKILDKTKIVTLYEVYKNLATAKKYEVLDKASDADFVFESDTIKQLI